MKIKNPSTDPSKPMRIISRKLLEVREHPDGDLYFELDQELLRDLNWKAGDSVEFTDNKDGSFSIKKAKYSTIELDIDDDNLLMYMKCAHEKDMSFNELTTEAVKEMLDKEGF
jgi:bifunctional DNA-binding transcriptional regulator/antitoxin component of YhaV-PrlF toxin-antitoxin module